VQIADPRYLPRRLRLGGERRDEEATRDQPYEGAPLHRWFLLNNISESGTIRDVEQSGRVHLGGLLTAWAECSKVDHAAEEAFIFSPRGG